MNRTLRNLGLSAILASGSFLSGCAATSSKPEPFYTCGPGWNIMPLDRTKNMKDNSIESWQKLYDSIPDPKPQDRLSEAALSPEEIRYGKRFVNLPIEERRKLIRENIPERLYFGSDNPTLKDGIYLHNYLKSKPKN